MPVDLYKTLGVPKSAIPDQIKVAFRAKAKRHHPDRNVGDKKAAERFQAITLAYRVLSDPERRKRYDETGDADDLPDNRAVKLVSTLSQVLLQALTKLVEKGLDFRRQDLPALMRDCCECQLAQLVEQRQVLDKARKSVASLQGRFKTKQGDNYMEEVVALEITKIDRELERLSVTEQNVKDAVTWLKDCSFWRDEDMDFFRAVMTGSAWCQVGNAATLTKVMFSAR